MRSIVVGVDGSEKSYRALAFSAGLAQRESAVLRVCYVRPYAPWTTLLLTSAAAATGAAVPVPGPEAADTAVAAELTAEATDAFQRTGVDGRVVVSLGDPVAELARVAHRHRADLIVIGHTRRLRSRSGDLARRLTTGFAHGLLITP